MTHSTLLLTSVALVLAGRGLSAHALLKIHTPGKKRERKEGKEGIEKE
jgi:hypothetical protein